MTFASLQVHAAYVMGFAEPLLLSRAERHFPRTSGGGREVKSETDKAAEVADTTVWLHPWHLMSHPRLSSADLRIHLRGFPTTSFTAACFSKYLDLVHLSTPSASTSSTSTSPSTLSTSSSSTSTVSLQRLPPASSTSTSSISSSRTSIFPQLLLAQLCLDLHIIHLHTIAKCPHCQPVGTSTSTDPPSRMSSP